MIRLLVALTTLGLFSALAAYSYGKYVSRVWHPPVASPRVDSGITYRTPPDCGLDWLCLKTWAEGKPQPDATPEDLAALVERSNREANRRRILSGSDEQAIMHELWGGR